MEVKDENKSSLASPDGSFVRGGRGRGEEDGDGRSEDLRDDMNRLRGLGERFTPVRRRRRERRRFTHER